MQTPWILVIVFDTSSSLWLAHRTTTGQARVAHRLGCTAYFLHCLHLTADYGCV